MSATRRIVIGVILAAVPLFALAWVTRDRIIQCDDGSCVVQNRWTGVIRRVYVQEPGSAEEDTTLAPVTAVSGVDSVATIPPLDPIAQNEFIGRCRDAGVPVRACESMAMSESVVRREMGRNEEEPAGATNRRLVRLACVVQDVDTEICRRWMPR